LDAVGERGLGGGATMELMSVVLSKGMLSLRAAFMRSATPSTMAIILQRSAKCREKGSEFSSDNIQSMRDSMTTLDASQA
jgi:hypothetical protein